MVPRLRELLERRVNDRRVARMLKADDRRALPRGLTKAKLMVLDSVRAGNGTISGIANDVGKAKATVYYTVSMLKRDGYLSAEYGKTNTVRITSLGVNALRDRGFGRVAIGGEKRSMRLVVISPADYMDSQTYIRTDAE